MITKYNDSDNRHNNNDKSNYLTNSLIALSE